MIRILNLFYNFHWIAPGEAARSAQPYLGLWRPYLRGNRIKAIVNLRGPQPKWRWWHGERSACDALGVRHQDVRISSRMIPRRDILVALIDAFDAAPKPMMIKCSGGQDRTSLASALYLIHSQGWDAFDRAMLQFSRFPYLHFPKPHQRWLRQLVLFAREQAAGKGLADWLRDDYDRDAFAAWLRASGHGDSFEGYLEDRKR